MTIPVSTSSAARTSPATPAETMSALSIPDWAVEATVRARLTRLVGGGSTLSRRALGVLVFRNGGAGFWRIWNLGMKG